MDSELKQWLADIKVKYSAEVEQKIADDEHNISSMKGMDKASLLSLGFKLGPLQYILDNNEAAEKEQKAADEAAALHDNKMKEIDENIENLRQDTEQTRVAIAAARRAAALKTGCTIM